GRQGYEPGRCRHEGTDSFPSVHGRLIGANFPEDNQSWKTIAAFMTSGRYRGPFLNLANLNPRLPLYIMEMKTKISTALLVCLAAVSGCKDDNNDREVVKPSENPITTFIAGVTGFEILRGTTGPWEFGVV